MVTETVSVSPPGSVAVTVTTCCSRPSWSSSALVRSWPDEASISKWSDAGDAVGEPVVVGVGGPDRRAQGGARPSVLPDAAVVVPVHREHRRLRCRRSFLHPVGADGGGGLACAVAVVVGGDGPQVAAHVGGVGCVGPRIGVGDGGPGAAPAGGAVPLPGGSGGSVVVLQRGRKPRPFLGLHRGQGYSARLLDVLDVDGHRLVDGVRPGHNPDGDAVAALLLEVRRFLECEHAVAGEREINAARRQAHGDGRALWVTGGVAAHLPAGGGVLGEVIDGVGPGNHGRFVHVLDDDVDVQSLHACCWSRRPRR